MKKIKINSLIFQWQQLRFLLAFLILAAPQNCQTPPPATAATSAPPNTEGAEAPGSGWQAQQFLNFPIAYASITSTDPNRLDQIGASFVDVVANGYVITDTDGQAMTEDRDNPQCQIYIFQSTDLWVTHETISTCERGTTANCIYSSTSLQINNCSAVSVVTLPATVTFSGTSATLFEYQDPMAQGLAYLVVMVSDGFVSVTPKDNKLDRFDVHAGKAAYEVTPGYIPEGINFFAIPRGEEREFPDFVAPLQKMDQVRQAQSANLLLLSKNLAPIPMPELYQLNLRWLNVQYDDPNLSAGIPDMVDWNAVLPKGIPMRFTAQGQTADLRSSPYNPRVGLSLLGKSSRYPAGQKIVLAYDERIPGAAEMAGNIAKQLSQQEQIVVSPQGYNPENAGTFFAELEKAGIPTLVLSGD